MSKKRNKGFFNTPSQLPAKYYQNLKQAPSDETAQVNLEIKDHNYGPTDSGIPDDISTLASVPKGWDMPKLLKNICIVIPILTVILGFFWGLNASVNSIKTDTHSISNKVSVLEKKIDDTSKELTTEQNNIKVIMERIIGKIDRLFDNISFLQRSKENHSTTGTTSYLSKEKEQE